MVEQRPFKALVVGSSPTRPTLLPALGMHLTIQNMLRLLVLSAIMTCSAWSQSAGPVAPPATAFVPLFKGAEHKFQGPLPSAEFFFELPGHVELLAGSNLTVRFRASSLLLSDVSTATIELNGSPLRSLRLPGVEEANEGLQTVVIPLGADDLRTGWNKISVKCLMQTTDVPCRDVDNPACWFVLEKGTGINAAYKRLRLFPEPGRFPASITEEQLLHQEELVDGFPEDKILPLAAVLLPRQPDNAAFRSFVIAASRLGQPGYLPNRALQIGTLDDWSRLSAGMNGVLIGPAADLAALDLPVDVRASIGLLKAGEGMLAEFITGDEAGGQRRWIAVCGADDEGLTKAALALGSADALGLAAGNPWVIRNAPVISPLTERLAQPSSDPQTFERLYGGRLTLRGVFRNQRSFAWELPPGFETAKGSELLLDVTHAPGLDRGSAVQMEINDRYLPGIPLDKRSGSRELLRLAIPEGLPGRSPNRLVVDSYLDIGTTDCSHRNEERAWVDFSPLSMLNIISRPLVINGLDRLGLVLQRDAFLRRACILLPKGATAVDFEVVRDLALFLGKGLQSMPVLWPQAALYSADDPVPQAAVANTSVVLLGSAAQWPMALPKSTRLSVAAVEGKDFLRLQGHDVPFAGLPKNLVVAQYLASPWSADNCVVTVGGVAGVGGSTASLMLTDPAMLARLSGTTAGIDGRGRVFTYDVRVQDAQSLWEKVRSDMPKGLSSEETLEQLDREAKFSAIATTRNFVIAGVVLVVVSLMIRAQMRLRRIRTELRRQEENRKSGDV